ncbi:MAG: bifunctional demethylmenaquinone methyltransferase/2-methoxy-6-polyprenyl-1,4-benzoquinol methylase UbiE [Muribaculaceae bacterium]|jgi:demethylmenaquinone methyltransferase / 2-methoxy-6-polyprenyl-1,4-benzoquinol methylase|nr:bifunctional demethylmenaquinone methyltransferase/2-methoxy-6-polyprenyl-1,4-benzoquinol methylase UbiE [Muribaculaceae bacterium]
MPYKSEKILPYGEGGSKTGQVRDMFNSIAPAYDFMNRAMTFGIDRLWRRRAINLLRKNSPKEILDVATGTGDFAILLQEKLNPKHIMGIDLAKEMLAIAREKAAKRGLRDKITFQIGDCLNLCFDDGSFDAVTVAYGVRNFEHLDWGYREMYRVLAPGGILCVVELSTPVNPFIKFLYNIYTKALIPMVGRLISHDRRAYSYLPESIAAVPQGDDMLAIMSHAGFTDCRCIRLTFGVCSIYLGRK